MLHFPTQPSAAAISDGVRRMARIRRLSRCMRWLLAATAVLFVVLAVAIWFLSSDAALTRSLHALLGITDPSRAPALQLGPGYRVAGFSLLGLQLALVLRGIAHAHAMFGDFARGEVLTSATARRLRGIALLITLFALCSPLVKMLLVLLFTWSAPGEPHMLIHIQLEDILLGLLGGLLFALAWAMEEAAHVAEENRGSSDGDRGQARRGAGAAQDEGAPARAGDRHHRTQPLLLKSGKVKGIRFDTLARICEVLQCQPGDLLEYVPDEAAGMAAADAGFDFRLD